MHWNKGTLMVLLCTFLKAETLLFHGQTNATLPSNGHSDPDVYKQLLHLETVLNSIMMDQKQQAQKSEQQQKLLEREIQTAQMKISFLESENKILKERLDNLNSSSTSSKQDTSLNEKLNNLNSTSTFLLHENIILKEQIKILNSTSMLLQQNLTTSEDRQKLESIFTLEIEQAVKDSEEKFMKNMSIFLLRQDINFQKQVNILNTSLTLIQQNMSTSEDIKSLEDILTFEIEQTIRDSEEKMMKNVCAKITDLELRDRYLSLSLLDVHNNTARLSSSLSSLEAQQKQMKSEIQTLTNSQQHDITKLNDTITHLKNRVQSRVAFTAGILEEYDKHHTYTGTVKFAKVIYQVGGGYNPTTGVFTAPKAGLYLIFCTNVAYNHETFWTRIMINGSSKAGVMAYVSGSANVFQSASNLVVHQLQVGDRVWIEVHEGSHLYSVFPETTFSVIMINGSD